MTDQFIDDEIPEEVDFSQALCVRGSERIK